MNGYLRVRAGGESYAIDVAAVREVDLLGRLTPVPGASAPVLGLRDVRGVIVPVASLALLLRVPETGSPSHLVILGLAGSLLGLAVDGLEEVADLTGPADQTDADLLTGTLSCGADVVGILDVPRTLRRLAGEQS